MSYQLESRRLVLLRMILDIWFAHELYLAMPEQRPSPNQDPQALIAQIARIREAANLLVEKELAARGISGIVPAHGAVLGFLFRQQEPVPIKSLVERVGRVKSTVTGMVATLERHGYLYKQGCELDARSTRIGLTDKGLALRSHFEEISSLLIERTYGTMPEADRQQLVALLSIVEQNLMP